MVVVFIAHRSAVGGLELRFGIYEEAAEGHDLLAAFETVQHLGVEISLDPRVDVGRHEVARMMLDNDCGEIPVVDESMRPIGVVTDRDITMRVVAQGRNANEATAADAMTTPVHTLSTDASVKDCVQLMETDQIRRVPVVDAGGKLAGIVSLADLALAGEEKVTAEVVKEVSEPTKH